MVTGEVAEAALKRLSATGDTRGDRARCTAEDGGGFGVPESLSVDQPHGFSLVGWKVVESVGEATARPATEEPQVGVGTRRGRWAGDRRGVQRIDGHRWGPPQLVEMGPVENAALPHAKSTV